MNMLMHTRQIAPEFWKGYWKHSIGFDRMVDTLMDTEGSFKAFQDNYPPYDIVKQSETNWKIVMALAGFQDTDISVEQKENVLTIRGNTQPEGEYVFKGIATRKFKKVFPLVEGAEVTEASLKNGLLEVNINIAIPEEQKPKLIPINIDNS